MGIIQRQGLKNLVTAYTGILIGFISILIIQPRFLTPEELGLTRILYSFSVLMATIVPLGIGSTTLKYFPLFKNQETKNNGFFGFMILFPIIGFTITALAMLMLKNFIFNQYRIQSPLFIDYFYLAFPLIFIIAFITCFNVYCYALLKSTVPSFLNDVVSRLLIITVVVAYYLKLLSFQAFLYSFVGVYALQLIFIIVYIYYEDKPGFKISTDFFNIKGLRPMIKYSLVFWLTAVASIGIKELGTVVLGIYLTLDFVAVYAIAAFIPVIIEAPLSALDKIALGKISYAWANNDRAELETIYAKGALYMLLLGGILVVGVNINIDDLLYFLPEKYQQGKLVVTIISIGTFVNMATGLNNSILFYSEKYFYGALFLILTVICAFALQLLLIPKFGIEGAALGTSLATIFFNVANYFFVLKNFKLQAFNMKSLYVLAALAFCLFIGFVLPDTGSVVFNIIYRSLIVTIIYALLIYKLNIIPEFHKYLPWNNSASKP